MKRRISAVLLALGLSVSALSMGVYAEETEITTEAAAEEISEELAEVESEAAEAETEAEELSAEDQLKETMSQYLTEISGYSDSQIEQMLESDNSSTASIAYNWNTVKEEVGNFVEIESLETETSEDGNTFRVISHAKYDKLEKNEVLVTYEANQKDQSVAFSWEVQYSFGELMQRAGMNTLMGIGIVFVALVFLSWLIGKLHIIPDMIESRAKKNEPAAAPAPAPVPAAAPVVEEEDLTDDLELVAVITAAIAASETTSGDGFVVRSIKKSNKRNWQRA